MCVFLKTKHFGYLLFDVLLFSLVPSVGEKIYKQLWKQKVLVFLKSIYCKILIHNSLFSRSQSWSTREM